MTYFRIKFKKFLNHEDMYITSEDAHLFYSTFYEVFLNDCQILDIRFFVDYEQISEREFAVFTAKRKLIGFL